MDQSHLSGKILVAEDNESNQVLVQLMLTKMNLECEIANDGQIAVDMLAQSHYDLVLMDMQMPNLNGYEATRLLRKQGNKIPIVALTANAMKGDKEKCLQAGCDDYIAKPVRQQQLFETLSKYLSDKKSQQVEESSDSENTVNDSALISDLENDPDFEPVITVFISDLPNQLQSIQTTSSCGDIDGHKKAIHQVKGASGSAGFMVLSEKVMQYEQLLINQDLDQAKKELPSIIQLCEKILDKHKQKAAT